MKRRILLVFTATAAVIAAAALGGGDSKDKNLLLVEWAAKSTSEEPPVAILVEMGAKDKAPTAYASEAHVTGARVVHREGYRFRAGDKLIDPTGWEVSSHRGLRVPPNNAAVAAQEKLATVGVVLHLKDVQPDATLTLTPTGKDTKEKTTVRLKDVLAGHPSPVWDGAAVVRLVTTATPLVTARTEDDFPAAAYGPDGTLWFAYISYTVRDEKRRIEQPQYKEQPADFKALYTPDFADQLLVKYQRNGSWSEPVAVTGAREDLVRCGVAVEGNGTPWVAYSAHRDGNFDVYVRSLNPPADAGTKAEPRLNDEQRLTRSSGPDLGPVLCTDQGGRVWLACQSWDDEGTARIGLYVCKDGKWSEGPTLPGQKKAENRWYPAIAAGPDGRVAVAYDVYQGGDYDVHVAVIDGDKVTDHAVAASGKFEARPSLAWDAAGRLWIAYEEGTEHWGKDYGALEEKDGTPLYLARSVRVACLVNDTLQQPADELPTSPARNRNPNEASRRYAYPHLGLDGKGRLWLTYREKFGTRYTTHPGSYWITFARRLDGETWTPPVEVSHSDGLLDDRPVLLPHPAGGLLIFHNTDGRYTTPNNIDNQLYASTIDLPGDPVEPKLVAHEVGTKDVKRAVEERAAVARIRDYRIDVGGKKLQLLRGEFHRHTEISWDGGPDGSLEDMWRYAIDAATLDWIGNTDHDSGNGREYSWWLIQKSTDAYHVANVFTPMFTYERSVNYPHGHRNVLFDRRGIRTLPRLGEADQTKRVAGINADDTKMLYRYLKELDGICASHTSATGMGTDWRDNDPDLEPIVEIYQGDRMNYEYEGAPRSGHDPKGNEKPAQIGGWEPAGFISNAFKKGYRFGFQSSSDHWSTHISFCVVLAEHHDRAAILAALKKRHCYAATDDIVLDVRNAENDRGGNYLMGDAFKTTETPGLWIVAQGVKPLKTIEILKDGEVAMTSKAEQQNFHWYWADPNPSTGTHYYYVRVTQSDGELAWSSPMWIDYAK